jgi:hypothetical protein
VTHGIFFEVITRAEGSNGKLICKKKILKGVAGGDLKNLIIKFVNLQFLI